MTQMDQHRQFSRMVNNYENGNLFDFRADLKQLEKLQLLDFAAFCAEYDHLTIYEIQEQYRIATR